MKTIFSDKTRMAASLLTLFAVLCTAMPAKAQTYYYTPWYGPKGLAINTGMYVPFSQNQYSAGNYNYKLVDDSRLMLCPYIGLTSTAFDHGEYIFYGSDVTLNFAKGGKTFTFNDAGHDYTTTAKMSFIDFSMKLFAGYSITDELSVSLRSGIALTNVLTTKSWQTVDNGEKKDVGFRATNEIASGKVIFHVPIDLFVNYIISDHWFVRGSVDTRLITIRGLSGDITLKGDNNKRINMQNPFKSIGCSITFGFWWE